MSFELQLPSDPVLRAELREMLLRSIELGIVHRRPPLAPEFSRTPAPFPIDYTRVLNR